VLIGGSNCC
jgi:hypothetical protein